MIDADDENNAAVLSSINEFGECYSMKNQTTQ